MESRETMQSCNVCHSREHYLQR